MEMALKIVLLSHACPLSELDFPFLQMDKVDSTSNGNIFCLTLSLCGCFPYINSKRVGKLDLGLAIDSNKKLLELKGKPQTGAGSCKPLYIRA